MSNIKFTSDGKKVVVIGNLNAQEKIVQEIFVVDGSEIPSGEHFVVKSLHDAPAVSWKEKSLKEIEERYEKEYSVRSKELDQMQSKFVLKTRIIKEKLIFLEKLEGKLTEDKFTQLIDFISGDVKYIVREEYDDLEIAEYDESIASKDYGRFDSLRLVSIFGKTDGNLSYKMNEYYDGSGSSSVIYPCKSKEEAVILLRTRLVEKMQKGLTDSQLKTALLYEVEIPEHILEAYKAKKRENIQSNLDRAKKSVSDYKKELEQFS